MLDVDELKSIAFKELIKVYGRKYLQDNFYNTCICHGMFSDGTFMLFAGIKGSQDLPDHKADAKGWVVSATIWLDQATGNLLDMEYTME